MKTVFENCIKYPVHALTGLAFSVFVTFNECNSACQSDLADVQKAVEKYTRREEEEIFEEELKHD